MALDSSSAIRKVCWNSKCGTSSSTTWRPGWIVRSGRTAELCDCCGLAYQQSRFCETFHSDDAGWRTCNFCKKRVHCGCVASAFGVVLLDKGGVECIRCCQAHSSAGSKSLVGKHGQQLLAPVASDSGKVLDPAVRGWCEGFGAALAACHSDAGAWQSSSAARTSCSPPAGLAGPWIAPESDLSVKSKVAADPPSQEQTALEVLESGGEATEMDRSACVDRTKSAGGGDGGGSPQLAGQASLRVARPPGEGRGRNQLLPRYWPRITDQELKQINSGDVQSVITPLFEKMLSASDAGRIGRLVLPKACAEAYFPPIQQPEGLPLRIQDVTGRDWVFQFRFWPNNNSRMYVLEGVTPCIQSMKLHAGDTVTFSRLEADGKLVMGYRKAPTSLSSQDAGVTRAATTANVGLSTASSVVIKSADGWGSNVGVFKTTENGIIGQLWSSQMDRKRGRPLGSKSKRLRLESSDSILLKSNWEEVQELLRPAPSATPTTITIDGHEFEEYSEPPVFAKRTFLTSAPSGEQEQWAQCDDCGTWRRLPVDAFVPARWLCSQNSWDLTRAQCSAAQEVGIDKLEVLLGPGRTSDGAKQECIPKSTPVPREENVSTLSAAAGLDTLAQAASTSLSPVRTTKHPRHRPGCTCIVCIQPPSGKGPKHKASCICNVCVTVKRRFRTLMQRRKKRQFERESEVCRNKRGWPQEGASDFAMLGVVKSGTAGGNNVVDGCFPTVLVRSRDECSEDGPVKGAIDLNIQPDYEERISMVRLLQDATLPLSAYLHQQRLSTLYFGGPVSDHVSSYANSSHEDILSESSSKSQAGNGIEVAGLVRHEAQQTQTSLGYVEQPNFLESWDTRAVKSAEFSGDSVHSSSPKIEFSVLNNVVASTSAKKYITGAGRGRQICIGCGEPIGSAAKVCRRCGTCTAFGKKKRGVPL